MPQEGLSMRKIREVLRLRYDLGLLQHEIARSCSISQPTVNRYLQRASAAGLSWPLPDDCDDRRLDELLVRASQNVAVPMGTELPSTSRKSIVSDKAISM
jgi:DNA-binding MarR family transcriptional regulator